MSGAAIEVLAIRALDGRTTVKAFVDLRLGGITLKGAKIVQQEGQKPWLAMPSIKLDRGWQQIVELSKPLRERVTAVVLAAWEQRQRGGEVIPPGGRTVVHRIERRDERQEHVDELAKRFDERGPDDLEGI